MGRTEKEVLVSGITTQEVKEEINRWLEEWGIKKTEEREDFVKGRMGIAAGLGLTPAKYFEVSWKQNEKGVLVHTEGWTHIYGVKEISFAKRAILGGIARKKGWKTIEQLWKRLKALSK